MTFNEQFIIGKNFFFCIVVDLNKEQQNNYSEEHRQE